MAKDNSDEYATRISQPDDVEVPQQDDRSVIKISRRSPVKAKRPADSAVIKVAEPSIVATTQPTVPEEKLWFGMKRWVVLGLAALVLIVLFAPLFAVTKIVNTTETIMTTVTTEEPVTVTTPTAMKVYTGWLKVSDQNSGAVYQPPIFMYRGGPYFTQKGSTGFFSAQQQQQTYSNYYYPYYNNYGSQTVTTMKVDYSDEIVDVKYVNASNNLWDISLIGRDGKEKVIRNVSEYDLTKTGDITVDVTEKKTKTITNQVPQQVTKQVPLQLRVGLFQLIFGLY